MNKMNKATSSQQSQLEDDDDDYIFTSDEKDDDNFKPESENRGREKSIKIDFEKYPILENYCKELISMHNNLHVEEDSQHIRHAIAMLDWFVVDFEIFVKSRWQGECKTA